ncbi:MAG: hypothetical protein H7338_12760 [Candidatus Sericytochromatia bacterium]|nr:hypothetical protein [Candidatus Sericytochromatia bacterium]
MHGTWVGLSKTVDESALKAWLQQSFPTVPLMTQDDAHLLGKVPWPPIVFSVVHWPVPDFPTYVGFACFPGVEAHAFEVGTVLAQRLSADFDCRAICDGNGFGDDPSTDWTIIWEDGRSFLADDSDTDFGDGAGGPVRVVREIAVPAGELDAEGHLVENPTP